MTIKFDTIPQGLRRKAIYSEQNTDNALATLPENAPKVVVLGQKTASGTKTADTPFKVNTVQDVTDGAGVGSIAELTCKAALNAFPSIDLSCVPIDDAAGTSATGTIVVANVATSSGTLKLWIGNVLVEVTVTNGDAVNDIAAAINTAIQAKQHLMPCTSGVSTNTVTLTARNDGLLGNNIPVAYENVGIGATTFTVTQIGSAVAGATDPSITNALAAIAPEKYDIIVCTLNDSTNLGLLKTHLQTYASAQEKKWGIGVFGYTGVLATINTLAGTTLNYERLSVGYLRYSKTTERGHSLDYEVAAAYAAIVASMADPAMPLSGEVLPGIAPPDTAQRFTTSEMETCYDNGTTPLEVIAGEEVAINRAITCYTTNAASIADPTLLDLTTITALDYGTEFIDSRQWSEFKQAKKTDRSKKALKSNILESIRLLSVAEIWNNCTPDEVIIEDDGTDVTRVNTRIPAYVVPGLYVIANRIDLLLR